MKKAILISIIILGAVYQTFAQEKGKTRHMIISMYESYSVAMGKSPNVFITRDDTIQIQKSINFNLHVKLKDQVAAHENQIMQLLEPYYNDGWKLVNSSSLKAIDSNFYITRFFFVKDE